MTRESREGRVTVATLSSGHLKRGAGVEAELYDCPWCGSAQSIEHGLCQVCLMEFTIDTKVIQLAPRRAAAARAEHPSAGKPEAAGAE